MAQAVSPPVGRTVAGSAYLLAAVTTLLWVACSLPAGPAQIATDHRDATTPIHREAILLVPALLLLVLLPVGMALARRVRGAQAILASTDAFVAIYAGLALGTAPTRDDPAARRHRPALPRAGRALPRRRRADFDSEVVGFQG